MTIFEYLGHKLTEAKMPLSPEQLKFANTLLQKNPVVNFRHDSTGPLIQLQEGELLHVGLARVEVPRQGASIMIGGDPMPSMAQLTGENHGAIPIQ